ncbi:hypothetical protein QJS04_geneDACA003016 [Acorus gramineus]|uniref:Uncharacterized protein n=1 Tax=Acorus gramineus TaxID=55184 RepID=A0AAV9BWD3_ACOGR|nr:hypothetical protein QJS04_geneDACA003016 [Acorus gramineus]
MEGDVTETPTVFESEEVEAEEEKKIEEFFALIRRVKVLKDHFRKTKGSMGWSLSFELEDFDQVVEFKEPLKEKEVEDLKNGEREEEVIVDLDLRL